MPRVVDPSTLLKGSGLASPNTVEAQAQTSPGGASVSLEAHLNDPKGAHPATAISTDDSKATFFGSNVQGNLTEIAGLVPQKLPTLGTLRSNTPFSGAPDWGILKLADGGLVARGLVTPSSSEEIPVGWDTYVYPYYWRAPSFATSLVFSPPGNDPSDPIFNLDPALTPDPSYTGGGSGTTHVGGFVRGGAFLQTARSLPVGPGNPVVVSGAVFPADRGVLALFHWPPGGDVTAFLAQPLTTRVVAALKMGLGIGDEAPDGTCDGAPGGLFEEGDPTFFDFPGRASGQYDLVEIHVGLDFMTGLALPDGPQPGAGQVRLGTDPNAGVPPVLGGIPILGGTTVATGGGNDNNLFSYRLPYLRDYTNLGHTPTIQSPRYFTKPIVSLDSGTSLETAGAYTANHADYWTYQVARYRHRFLLQSPPSDQGSYLLLHFQREADFEAFARDGILPSDPVNGYPLWSANLSDDTDPEDVLNIAGPTSASPGYHVLRGALFEDVNLAVGGGGLSFTYLPASPDTVMFASGVQYFVSRDVTGETFRIDSLRFQLTNLFANSFLLGSAGTPAQITPGLQHRDPVFLHLGGFTSEFNVVNGEGPQFAGILGYQRVFFPYHTLGAYDLSNPPVPADTADVELTGADTPIQILGDSTRCHFWQDAQLRVFAAKPVGHQHPMTTVAGFDFPSPGGDKILYHTTGDSPSVAIGSEYGNFTIGGINTPPRPNLENPRKDVEERFLDEVYRVRIFGFTAVDPTFDFLLNTGNLVGPGVPFVASPIEFPVRVASAAGFENASILYTHSHLLDLSSTPSMLTEAQVAGFPARNPPITDGAQNLVPFSGILQYPKADYTTGFRPSLAAGDTTVAQPDYSSISNTRRYIRAFDAAYRHASPPEPDVVGQPLLRLRIDGLRLSDFGFLAPGPGTAEIAILLKIPGLTSWMDVGRRDGDGPSKQDPLADGAGCQVVGPETYNDFDPITGVVFSRVLVNVGPLATVFANQVVEEETAPVLIQVIIKPPGAAFDFTQGGPNGSSNDCRGLVGITILRHSTGLGPNPFGPF